MNIEINNIFRSLDTQTSRREGQAAKERLYPEAMGKSSSLGTWMNSEQSPRLLTSEPRRGLPG